MEITVGGTKTIETCEVVGLDYREGPIGIYFKGTLLSTKELLNALNEKDAHIKKLLHQVNSK